MGEIDGFGSTKVMIVDSAGNPVTTGNPLPAGFTGTFSGASGAVTAADGALITEGAVADAAVTGDTGGSLSAKLRGLNKTVGAAADANTVATVMGRLTKIRDLILAKLAVTVADGDDATIGAIGDASVAANATGSVSAKLRRVTQGLEDLKTLIVLAAGTNKIGGVTVADGDDGTQGAKADAAYTSGSGSVISLLKGLFARLRGGQATMANSLPVTMASDQGAIGTVGVTSASSATLANVGSSVTNVTLLAANATRRGATIANDSTANLMIKHGATASATSFTAKVPAGGLYELPQPIYTGIVDGIWDVANGSAHTTEAV